MKIAATNKGLAQETQERKKNYITNEENLKNRRWR